MSMYGLTQTPELDYVAILYRQADSSLYTWPDVWSGHLQA